MGRLRERFGTSPAIVGAATLFAAWHLLNFGGSILNAVLTHGLYNLTLMAITYVQL